MTTTTLPDHPVNLPSTDVVVEPGEVTPAQVVAADDWVQEVRSAAAAAPWRTQEGARKAGYEPMPLSSDEHWFDPAAVDDDTTFDPEHPELIVFHGGELMGVMFLADSPSPEQDPPVGSPVAKWHFHTWKDAICFTDGMIVAGQEIDGRCPEGSVPSNRSPLMVHVWLTGDDPFVAEVEHHHG